MKGNNKGHKHTDEYKKNCSERMKKFKRTAASNLKRSNTLKGRVLAKETNVICPHCKKNGVGNAMYRWHFDNCKRK